MKKLTLRPAAMECSLMLSCRICLSPPAFTHCMRMTSVAMKGNSKCRCALMTAGHTYQVTSHHITSHHIMLEGSKSDQTRSARIE